MSRLVGEITGYIEARMRDAARTLHDRDATLRSVFHGPPLHFLEPVLHDLTADGGLGVTLGNGDQVTVPVLLPVEWHDEGRTNPPVGAPGRCDASHLLALRNTPACPRFLTLAAPAGHNILSVAQATDEFGMSSDNNSGAAAATDWWADPFIQHLVSRALARNQWRDDAERDEASKLLEQAVLAADEGDRHDPRRPHGWSALARVLSISDPDVPFGTQWSLACGFPPMGDGGIDAKEQSRVLGELMDAIVDEGFAPCADRLRQKASEDEQLAIQGCFRHLQHGCEVSLALVRAAPFYYAPARGDAIEVAPSWWKVLTAERLAELLEQEGGQPVGALDIRCTNSIVAPVRGLPPVVVDGVELEVGIPEETGDTVATKVTRDSGARANQREWQLELPADKGVTDDAPPPHRQPVRYSATAEGLKKAAVRVVSLAGWEPGVIVASRTAVKAKLPAKARKGSKHTLECELVMAGEGRHLLELHVAPGITLDGEVVGRDTASAGMEELKGTVSAAAGGSGVASSLEVEATAECQYDLWFTRANGEREWLRIQLSCADAPTEGCRSEFERLIRLNRPKERVRPAAGIQVNRQVRVADLQAWALSEPAVERSYYPLVLASDSRDRWREPAWRSAEDTVLSTGRFLHDPRPPMEEMRPPREFIEARAAIAARIRDKDEQGLIEMAELGDWMRDREFADAVDAYVRAYTGWLEAEPDVAAWADLIVVCRIEPDGRTLVQEPEAVLVSPLHPVRLGWHCLAQRALWEAWRAGAPCPAASILDPDSVPDVLALPLRMPSGVVKPVTFLATDCSSDYWAVLWNGDRIDRLATQSNAAPFDAEFGIRLGGVSSGFSVSQVGRSLDDVSALLAAKPVLNVAVASSAGQSDACNEGIMAWARERFSGEDAGTRANAFAGTRQLQVFDGRKPEARPEDAAVANLAEDTAGAVRWFSAIPEGAKPDLGIIAQLETSNAAAEQADLGSPLGFGALVRHRVRTQLSAGSGAFLSESRMGVAGPPSGEGLADGVMRAVARLENLGDTRMGYTFAPSVQAIEAMFKGKSAEYVAVSSSAVDPACFLGSWLSGIYLWDYELPSYSHRAGDSNGYYLLSGVKPLDCEALQRLLSRLPGCDQLGDERVQDILLEVSRRGIPTVRGLSAGHSGAAGDLGLFLAGRLMQDEFRAKPAVGPSIVEVHTGDGETHEISLVVPVDPFRGYLLDLQHALGLGQFLRPDLMVATIEVTDSAVRCRVTPVEVKYRRDEVMHGPACRDALAQAGAMSHLLNKLREQGNENGLVIWKLAFQHLLLVMLDFGFRVYSQQLAAAKKPGEWSRLHQAVMAAILADEAVIEVDTTGRLVVFDASSSSGARDIDEDGFKETVVISARDAACIVAGDPAGLYASIRQAIGDWDLSPSAHRGASADTVKEPPDSDPQQPQDTKAGQSSGPVQPPTELPPAGGQPITSGTDADWESPVRDDGLSRRESQPPATSPHDGNGSLASAHEGLRVLVGSTIDDFREEPRHLRPSLTALNQLNMGVVGDLGTGKTQLVKSLVHQISHAADVNGGVRPRFLIFDYKKDYSSQDFVEAVGARVVTPRQLPLNLFDVSQASTGTVPWLDRFKFFADVLDKIYSNVGPVQRENLKQAVRDAYQSSQAMGRQPTIYDVHDRYRANVGGKPDAPLSIIGDMVDMDLFTRDPAEAVPFGQFLDGVVVLSLDALGQDDRTKNMLVAIMLNMFYEHMLRIPKRPYRGTDPQLRTIDSYLLVDEADNIMRYEFDVLRKVLLQGREFGVGVILASQYLRHFKVGSTDYREPLLSWFIHKVPNVTAQELAALGLTGSTAQLAERVRQLGNHQCLYKTFDVPGEVVRGMPFYQLVAQAVAT